MASSQVLRFGNISDIIRARHGQAFVLFARKASLQEEMGCLRTEYDPEVRKYVVPGHHEEKYERLQQRIEYIEQQIKELGASIVALEAEEQFLRDREKFKRFGIVAEP